MRAVRCALIALTIALPVSAQTPAQLDSMRVELVRCIAFGKGADTQATKALNELAAGDTAAARVEMVRSRGMVRALITQCDKSLVILDRSRGIAPPDTVIPGPPVEPEPEPEPEPPVWATGRWSLTADGQPLALDFDEARLELPAGMGVVAVTADVTADTAHLTFQTPYGAGVMRLVHASDRVTGSMSVAGQSAAVTGDRAVVQPEPDVPEPPAPPAGDGTPFFEDTFDSGRTTSANGFRWTNSRYVDVVDGALRFRYGPIEPNGQTHMWAEQRFSLPRRMTEVWVEFYIRYSKNFVHEGTRNDKFFRIWGGDYNNQNKVGLCTWGRNGADPIIQFDRTKPEWSSGIGPSGGPSATWPISRMKDGWHRVRMHYRHATTAQRDALFQLWLDDELLINWVNADQKYTSQPYWDSGYILGYDNSGHSQDRQVWVDNVRFYDSDPGW